MRGPRLITTTGILCLALLLAGGPWQARGAGPPPEKKLVLVLDGPGPAAPPEVAALVQLLPEEVSVGIITPAGGGKVLFPGGRLSAAQRQRALEELARPLPPGPRRPLMEFLALTLEGLGPRGREDRALLVVGGAPPDQEAAAPGPPKPGPTPEEVGRRSRSQGVQVFAVLAAAKAEAAALAKITGASGGRLWLTAEEAGYGPPLLEFYALWCQPQQTPMGDKGFLLDGLVQEAVIAAPRAAAGQPVVLTDPGGGRLTPTGTAKGARWLSLGSLDLVLLPQPRPGWWSLSGAREGQARVFLLTDLKVQSPWSYEGVAADETMTAALTLTLRGEPWLPARGETTAFQAVRTLAGQPPETVNLAPPTEDLQELCPPGVQLGWFPPPARPGEGSLRLRALGPSFQRELTLPLAVGPPWYELKGAGSRELRLTPLSGGGLRELRGLVRWGAPGGGLAGVGLTAPPGADIHITPPPGPAAAVEVLLTGRDASGRPVRLAHRIPLGGQPPAGKEKPPAPSWAARLLKPLVQVLPASLRTGSSRWVWLGLGLAGLGLFFGAAFLVLRLGSGGRGEDEEEGDGTSLREKIALFKSQVEILQKEKAQLQAALAEAQQALEAAQAEKASLEAELQKQVEKSKADLKSLEEVAKKLEEAEQEAKSVQEEYMALYARTQGGKETLKRD